MSTLEKKTSKQQLKLQTAVKQPPTLPTSIILAKGHDIAYIARLLQHLSIKPSLKLVIMMDADSGWHRFLSTTPYRSQIAAFEAPFPKLERDALSTLFITPQHKLRVGKTHIQLTTVPNSPPYQLDNLPIAQSIQEACERRYIKLHQIVQLGTSPLAKPLLEVLAHYGEQIYVEQHRTLLNDIKLPYQIEFFKREAIKSTFTDTNDTSTILTNPIARPSTAIEDIYQALLDWFKSKGKIDFSHFRQSWLATHIEMRKAILGLTSSEQYLDYCLHNEKAYLAFLTNMRHRQMDASVLKVNYNALCSTIADIKKSHHSIDKPVRIWVIGCGQGELAYLTAIACLECDEGLSHIPVNIFATDLHEESVIQASKGISQSSIKALSQIVPIQKYVSDTTDLGHHKLDKLRHLICFASHDLHSSPPLDAMDLIISRNILWMYKIQSVKTLLTRFHNSLNTNGWLMTDSDDNIDNHGLGFKQAGDIPGLYKKVNPTALIGYKQSKASALTTNKHPPTVEAILEHHPRHNRYAHYSDVMDRIIEEFVPPGFLVNCQGDILHVFGDTSPFLKLFAKAQCSKDLFSRLKAPLGALLLNTVTSVMQNQQPIYLDNLTIVDWFQKHDATPPQLAIEAKYYKSKKQCGEAFCGLYFEQLDKDTIDMNNG